MGGGGRLPVASSAARPAFAGRARSGGGGGSRRAARANASSGIAGAPERCGGGGGVARRCTEGGGRLTSGASNWSSSFSRSGAGGLESRFAVIATWHKPNGPPTQIDCRRTMSQSGTFLGVIDKQVSVWFCDGSIPPRQFACRPASKGLTFAQIFSRTRAPSDSHLLRQRFSSVAVRREVRDQALASASIARDSPTWVVPSGVNFCDHGLARDRSLP
jgi:hypothetical protein